MYSLSGNVTRYVGGVLLLAVMLIVSAVAGSGQFVAAQDGATDPNASIRFVHASPDAPAVDIVLDGEPVAQGLEFGEVTEYTSVSSGDHSVQVIPAGEAANAALVDHSFGVDSDQAYTVAVANLLNELEVRVYQSNLDDLPDGESRIRTVNLSPDFEGIDVYQVGGDQWFGGVNFGDASDHRNVAEGTYDLDLREGGSDQTAHTEPGLVFQPGNEYSLYILGQQSADSLRVLPLVVSVSTPCSTTLNIGDIADDACVRIVHALLDGPAFDVYVEDALVIAGLEPGTSTEFLSVPPGDGRSVKLVPEGGSPDDPTVDSGVDFQSRRAVDVVIGGSASDIKVINDPVDLSPIPVDQARVRAIHVSPDAGDVDVMVTDGDNLFEGVGFESFTDWVIVDAGEYDIQVRRDSDVLFRATELEFESGMVYGLIAQGSVDNGTFTVLVISGPSEPRTGAAADTVVVGTPDVATEEAEELSETTPTPLSEAQTPETEATSSPES